MDLTICQPAVGSPPDKVMGGAQSGLTVHGTPNPGAAMWVTKSGGKQFTTIKLDRGFDWKAHVGPILPKDADGNCPEWCPATHFGYLASGTMGVKMKDGTEKTIKAGESYLIPPGHLPAMEEDAVMVEFSQDTTYTADVKPGAPAPAPEPVYAGPMDLTICQPDLASPPDKKFGADGTPAAAMWVTKSSGKMFSWIKLDKGFDWKANVGPILPKDADGNCPEWCPATHFGYLASGTMGVKMKDGTEKTIKAGESYLIPPGHLPVMNEDALMVEFSQDATYTADVKAGGS